MSTHPRVPRRPSPKAVICGSLALFAVLFALLTFQLSASADSAVTAAERPAAAGRSKESAAAVTATDAGQPLEAEEEETLAAEELEAAELEAVEIEAAEIEAEEEVEPVVTSSS